MKLYFFSDTHISSNLDPIYISLCDVIRGLPQPGDALVLGGDIFDLLVGNSDYFVAKYAAFFKIIESLILQGVRVYYIQGNHDFQIDLILKKVGVMVCEPDLNLELDGKKFYIAHGDLVNRSDYGYLVLRKSFRSKIFGAVINVMPGALVDQIGNRLSLASRMNHPVQMIPRIRELFRGFAVNKIKSGFDFVILGHCHDLDEMTLETGERLGHYINMGYPKVHGKYLTWESGQTLVQRADLPIGKLE